MKTNDEPDAVKAKAEAAAEDARTIIADAFVSHAIDDDDCWSREGVDEAAARAVDALLSFGWGPIEVLSVVHEAPTQAPVEDPSRGADAPLAHQEQEKPLDEMLAGDPDDAQPRGAGRGPGVHQPARPGLCRARRRPGHRRAAAGGAAFLGH